MFEDVDSLALIDRAWTLLPKIAPTPNQGARLKIV